MIKGKEGLVSVNIEDVSKTEWWAEVHLVSSEVGQQVCVCVCMWTEVSYHKLYYPELRQRFPLSQGNLIINTV